MSMTFTPAGSAATTPPTTYRPRIAGSAAVFLTGMLRVTQYPTESALLCDILDAMERQGIDLELPAGRLCIAPAASAAPAAPVATPAAAAPTQTIKTVEPKHEKPQSAGKVGKAGKAGKAPAKAANIPVSISDISDNPEDYPVGSAERAMCEMKANFEGGAK